MIFMLLLALDVKGSNQGGDSVEASSKEVCKVLGSEGVGRWMRLRLVVLFVSLLFFILFKAQE